MHHRLNIFSNIEVFGKIARITLIVKILEKLGGGGMGVVYKAEDAKLKRFVALKFLPPDLTRDDEAKERFVNEAQAASALDHPNICTIYEIDQDEDGRMFIAMAYYEGETLQTKVSSNQLSVISAIDIAIQIAQGLAKAHEHGIIHRDIKPANVIITKDGVAKILDFGLAKLSGQTRLTKVGTTMGTVAYMSPEQTRGVDVDHRADIWALGVVLYEMITGQLPFKGEYEAAVMYSIVNEDPEPLARCRSDVPEALQMIVEKALQKDAGTRYQTAIEILTDLKSSQAGVTPTFAESLPHKPQEPAPNNLPIQLTSFIGREREISEVKRLLATSRLLTLTGPGGTGKTRLALQATVSLRMGFEHDAFFVALAPVNDPKLVASTIAQTLGVGEVGGQPPLESLKQYLRDKQMLLLLDNFEQIVAAATVVTELLTACPKLKILVTSRASLHVSGEQEFPVPPLSLPDLKALPSLEVLSQSEAVALFVQRAQAVKPDFALNNENASSVAEICIRLDGLPLAVELAAARIKLLTPQTMLPRLKSRLKLLTEGPRDLPARQQTLRGAIEWSYALLDEDEKKLLRRLSVFAGGCTLEAAEAVCNTTTDLNVEILDGMASLVDKSLLRQSEQSRFLMLETIREFGLDCLTANGETEAFRRAHRDFFLKFSEEAEPQLIGPQQKGWLERLDQEHDNLRAAFDWSLKNNGDLEAGLRFGAALWRFWLIRGHLDEGRERLANLLANVEASVRTEARVKVLTGAGTLAQNQADYTTARSFFEESLTLYRELADKRGIVTSLNNLGWVAWRLGDYAAARTLSEESLALHRELGDKRGIATSMNNLGIVTHHQGDYTTARSFHHESLTLRRELGDKRSIAFALSNLGWTMQKQGDYGQASAMLEEALALFQELGDKQLFAMALRILADLAYDQGDYSRAQMLAEKQNMPIVRELKSLYGIAWALRILGDIACHQGDYSRAAALYEESLAIRRETKDKWSIAESLHRLGEVARHQGDYGRAFSLYKESLVLRKEMADKMGIVECLEGLAGLARHQNQLERATQLLGSAEALREMIGAPLPPCLRTDHERMVTTIRTGLDQQEFATALTQGRNMTIEQMIAFALSEV
jgi:predicted ATPase/Tfp pilus assembly protein PilF/predicted Ser/Thr protein kinase